MYEGLDAKESMVHAKKLGTSFMAKVKRRWERLPHEENAPRPDCEKALYTHMLWILDCAL